MDNLKHASTRGAAWNLLQNLVSRLLGLAVVAILGRLLDRSAFGGVALALAITTLSELLVNQGYGEFVTQRKQLSEEHTSTAFWLNIGLGATLTGLLVACASPIAHAFDEPGMTPVLRLLALSLLVRSFGIVPAGLLVRAMRFRALSMRTVVASAVGGAAGITAAFAGLGVYSLVIQVLAADVIATAVIWRATGWSPTRRVSRDALAELKTFGTPIIGAALLGFASRRLDAVVIGGALGLSTLGVYTLAQRVFQIAMQVLNKSSVEVVFSALSRLDDTVERRRDAFYRVIEVTAVLCFPTYVGLAIVSGPLTVTLLGARWTDSAAVLLFFALSGVPFSLTLMHMATFKSTARTRLLLVANLTLLIVYVPLLLLLVERGPAAAAAASLIACTVVVPVEVWLLRGVLGLVVGRYLRSLQGASLATAVMTAITLPLSRTIELAPGLQLLVLVSVGVASYALALRYVAPTSFARCRELVRQVVRRAPRNDSKPSSGEG